MALTYTDVLILTLGITSVYAMLEALGLKWRIEHIQQVRRAKRGERA